MVPVHTHGVTAGGQETSKYQTEDETLSLSSVVPRPETSRRIVKNFWENVDNKVNQECCWCPASVKIVRIKDPFL